MAHAAASEAAFNKQEPVWLDHGEVPEEARFVRMLGCPDTRQFEVLELGMMLFLREVATKANPYPGPFVATLPMAGLFKAMAVDVLKANDALDREIERSLSAELDA